MQFPLKYRLVVIWISFYYIFYEEAKMIYIYIYIYKNQKTISLAQGVHGKTTKVYKVSYTNTETKSKHIIQGPNNHNAMSLLLPCAFTRPVFACITRASCEPTATSHVSPVAAFNCVETIHLLSHPHHIKHPSSNGFNTLNTHSTLIFSTIVNGLTYWTSEYL
jgi:hypothetical protein